MRSDLPSGTVTFLFTDVEGSTRLLHKLGADGYAAALMEHRRLLRQAFTGQGGVEVDTQGDAFFVAFPSAPGALAAAAEAQRALASGPIRVRMGIHTGTPHLGPEGYIGTDVHKGARIAAVGHGGQVLLSAATVGLIGGQGLRDLGDHRLKDLSAPERIHQLGDGEFPPLTSLHQTNLPIPSTPFLGREAELAELGLLLNRDDVRLLTLTGPGGTGKTRLALAAAGAAADAFPGGVWWVPLASLRDAALVMSSAAQALGASGELAEHIGDARLLLLLDNFEHLLEAAAGLGSLLSGCPNLTLFVTSREPLHVGGELEYSVDPLRDTEAVELFTTRALAARRDFVANGEIRQICRRLDNLPLAIELAAARVKVMSPAALLARLEQALPVLAGGSRDAPERQRTLQATIEWSHDLLTDGERHLFRRLAVFRGGCTLEVAEAVAEADLDTLASLVDKSLVRQRDDRFWMLETIREFALERLEASGEADELRARHADHFLALAEEAEPQLRQDEVGAVQLVGQEHDNLRAAIERLMTSDETQKVLRLASAVSRFWYLKGHLREGWRHLDQALAAAPEPTPARAWALNGAAVMALNLGDTGNARLMAQEALALHRAIGDDWGTAYSTMMVANAAAEARAFAEAQPLFDESLRLFRELGDERYALVATTNLAWVTEELGDLGRSRALHEENLQRARELHHLRMVAASLDSLYWYARDEQRFEDAQSMLRESLGIYSKLGDPVNIANSLSRFSSLLALTQDGDVAARLLGCSTSLYGEVGVDPPAYVEERNERTRHALHELLGEEAFAAAWDRGRRMTVNEAVALAIPELT